MLQLLDFNENPNLGVFCKSNDNVAFIRKGLLKKVKKKIEETLDVKLVELSIADANIIGSLLSMNSKGAIVTDFVDVESVKQINEQGMDVFVINDRLNAAGNNILVNDKGALVHPDLNNKSIKNIEEILKVSKLERFEKTHTITSIEGENIEDVWSVVEEARLFEEQGNYFSSAKKFSIAATKFKKFSSDQYQEEITALYYLCKAWECMGFAEEYNNTQKFGEAIELFNQANEHLSDKNLKLLISGNSVFCEALKLSLVFDKSDVVERKEKYYPKIKSLIEKAIKLYKEGDYKKEAEWAMLTLSNLDKV